MKMLFSFQLASAFLFIPGGARVCRVVPWPSAIGHVLGPEKRIWPAPWCVLVRPWPRISQRFHSGTSSFLFIDQPSSTCQIPADSSRCNPDIT